MDYTYTDDNIGVSEVPTNCNTVAAMCSHAIIHDSNDATEISTCEVGREHHIFTTKEAVTA